MSSVFVSPSAPSRRSSSKTNGPTGLTARLPSWDFATSVKSLCPKLFKAVFMVVYFWGSNLG